MEDSFSACFLRYRGRILIERTEDVAGDRWDVPTGRIEDDPETTAWRVIERVIERPDAVSFVRAGASIETAGTGTVHPYLFDAESGGASANPGEVAWVHPTDVRRRETQADLWERYEAVAPTIESVREDGTHGSAYVSTRALEVLRDRAAIEEWEEVVGVARELLAAHPIMAALENRVNRAMFEAETPRSAAVERAARRGIDRAVAADDRAATRAADAIEGTVLTLSRSGTVEAALLAADPEAVVVLESRPDREGTGVATRLADAGLDATLTLDAAVSHAMEGINTVVVGADTVLADGSLVNKVGTRTAAVAAAREGVPVYAVSAADKISPATDPVLERVPAEAITGDDAVAVECPLFDRTPADLLAGVIAEGGVLDAEAVAERADERERWAGWSKGPNPPTE